jgi:hypothetical protein
MSEPQPPTADEAAHDDPSSPLPALRRHTPRRSRRPLLRCPPSPANRLSHNTKSPD